VIGEEFERVLARARAGDEAAFARLWRDLNPALLRYLSLAGESEDEVAAETWLTVVKGLAAFRGDESAWRAWVFTTARRRAVDAGRQRTRAARAPWRDRSGSWVTSTEPDCADLVIDSLSSAEAIRIVRQLPALQAEVVLLRVVVGLPVSEAAELVGRSPGAVRVAAHRGLQKLAQIMSETGVTLSDSRALREVT
jgi:RNA polymerase sigma-70 factor (ECF subfamily)